MKKRTWLSSRAAWKAELAFFHTFPFSSWKGEDICSLQSSFSFLNIIMAGKGGLISGRNCFVAFVCNGQRWLCRHWVSFYATGHSFQSDNGSLCCSCFLFFLFILFYWQFTLSFSEGSYTTTMLERSNGEYSQRPKDQDVGERYWMLNAHTHTRDSASQPSTKRWVAL